jgi:hypothetical protein
VTDSEEYREGKVKRTPGGELKEPETSDLQTVRGPGLGALVPGRVDGVPFVE